jgi:hypothetical protein
VGLVGDVGGLLVEGEFEDAAAFFLTGEGGEDLVVETEVGVVHVGALDGFGEREGEAAEEGDARFNGNFLPRSPSWCGGTPLLPARNYPLFIDLRDDGVCKIFITKVLRPKYSKQRS